ncbi:MAG: FmdB family zinc ribbon protein [Lysobacterales bacterium]
MPIYEYRCQSCGSVFENLQKLSDPDPEQCPSCGQAQITRLLSAPSFRLAGSGWYETDFKKDGDKKRNLAGDTGGGAEPAAAKPDSSAAPTPPASTTTNNSGD